MQLHATLMLDAGGMTAAAGVGRRFARRRRETPATTHAGG